MERTLLYEHLRYIATSLVEGGLDDRSDGTALRIGLELEKFGFEEYLLQ